MFTFHLLGNEKYKCGCDDVVQEDLTDLKSRLLSRLRDLESLPEGLRGLELSAEDVALHSWNGSKVTVKQDLLLLQKLSKEACNIDIGIRNEDLVFTSMETNPINTSIAAANCIDLFTDNMYKDFTAVEELVDNCFEGAKGQEVPEIHLKLDQINDIVVLEDNGIGVSYDSSSNIGDITSRGADTKAQGERRKQAAFKAAQILHPERWGVMRSGVLGNFGWGLKGATGYLLANGRRKGELRFVTKRKSNRYRTTWISKPGDELAKSVTSNLRNGQIVEEFAKSSGTRIILKRVDPSRVWGKKDWTGQGERFIDDLASRLAGTYDAYLHPVGELAGFVLGKVQALAGSEDKVTSHSPLFSTRTGAGKLAKRQMADTLQLLKDSAQQQPRPKRFKLTVELDYRDADGQPQHAERDCSSDEYKSQVYMRQAFQHAVSCLPLHFSVQTEDEAGEAAAGGTLQVYLAYVPKVAAGDEKLQAARRRAGLDIGSEQMQPLWEMKALSDPVDLGLLDKARANKEYKADFADLSMESIHGFMMVPKPFATTLSKAGLEEKELLKAVRRAISDGDAPEIVGRWVRQMLNDHERTSTISADRSTLTANGGLFKRGEVVSLQKKRRAKTSDELKPFETAGAIFVLRGFQLDDTHNVEAEDQVLCKLSPYHATKAADEAYLVPLRSFLLHKVAASGLQKIKESQPWIAPASLVSATLHTGIYSPGRAHSSSSSRRQSLSESPESILVGDTCADQYASVTDDMSGTRSGSSPNAQIAFDLLRKSRWSKAQFEVRQPQTAGYFCSPVYDLVRPSIQGKVAFGTVGNSQSPSGAWCFDAPGKYEVRLHLGQDTFASGNLQVRAGSSAEQHAVEGAAATISSPWYPIEVEAPGLRHAERFELVKPPSQIRRGVPTDLCLSFKRGSQVVCLTDSDVAGLDVRFNVKIAESIVPTLEQSSAADGPDHVVKLKGLRFEAGLGPVTMKITVRSADATLHLSCSCPCLVTVGLPTTILPGMQAQGLVNGSDCNALQPSVAFLDEQGGQVGGDCDTVRPGLIGPLSGRPKFTYVDNEQCWQASLDTCRAESPLYSLTDDQGPSFHTDVIPVEVESSSGNSMSAASLDPSTAGSSPQIGMGLLEEDGDQVASVLCIGNAVQYSQRQGRTAMGIITGFHWGTNTEASGLQEVKLMRRQDVKLTLTGLKAVQSSPHHVTVAPEPKQPLTITASAVTQQLHVLSTAQAHAAFPGGCSNSRVGSAVLICDGLNGSEASTAPSWECIGLLCVLLGSNGTPTSALCKFEQVIISPSAEPAAVLLSQRPVDILQVMTAADVAAGLAGPDVGDQDEHGNLKLQGGAASQIGTVAALLLDEAGQPTAPAVEKRFTLKCSWHKSAVQLLPDQSTYQLPAITLTRAYEPLAQTVVLKRNTAKLYTAELTAEPTPNGVSPQARLLMPAQLPTSAAQDQGQPDKPVVSAGSRVEVEVALLGTEEAAAAWQNAPLQFSLSNVQMGLKPESMVAAEVSTTTDADGQQHFTAAVVLPTQTCALGDQRLLLTATAVYNPQLENQMDTAEAEDAVSTTDVRGELDVSLGRGVAATAEFLRPPSTVKELSEQRFTVQLKDVDGNLADLNPDSKLYLTFNNEHVKELTSANRDGLYTCKHDMQMLPETHDLAVTAEGSDVVMISEQAELNVEVLAQDFVTGIKAAVMSGAEAGPSDQQPQLLDATQLLQGEEVAVLVQLKTHSESPLVVSKAGVRRHCKVRIGSSEFKLRDSTGFNDQDACQVVMHGVLPVTAGQHVLSASWTEERAALGEQMRKAKMLGRQELAWTKPVDANCMVQYLCQITVLAKPISKLQLQGEISPSIALSVGFKFPEQQWCLADDSGNQHSNINSYREARRCLQFKAAIVVAQQDMTLAAGSASSVPKFAVNQQSSYTWEATAVEERTACFSLPEEVLHLSEQPCGLTNKHRLELRLTAERGLTKDLAPLRIPFMYSDRPAEVGDIQANQKIISDLQPEKVKRIEAAAHAKKESHAAKKALQGAKTKLSQATTPVDGLEDVDAALEHVETQLRKVEEQIDQWQDGAGFRVPRPETGPLLPASLGKRIAFDLPYLTSDLGLEDTSDASPDQTQWTLGSLSGAEGSALVRGASACLQQQMAGMLCKTGEEVFTTLRHQHPRNVLLPIPTAVNVSNQLQDYFYQGASAKPDGLLGFLHEAFSILPQDTDVSRDSRVEVDDAAVRRGLSLWLEGALTFCTSKQAFLFAQSRAIRGAHCPPILALDQPGGLLRLQGICLAGLTSATVPGEVDTVVEFGVLGYEDSRLAAQMDAQNDNLNEQREAITSCLAADGKAKQAQEKYQQAEKELQTWLSEYEAELEKALQATGASSSNKRKAGTASQPVVKKRVRS